MNILKIILLSGLFLILCCVICFGIDLYLYADKAPQTKHEEKLFTILNGEKLKTTALKLSEQGLIRSPLKFIFIARIKKRDKQIRAGEYLLSPHMTPRQIISLFTSGQVFLHKLTIPEGYSMAQIADTVEQSGLGSSDVFLNAAKDYHFAKRLGIPGATCEGYLYPETYHFPKGVSEKEIIKTMVNRLRAVVTPEWEERARDLNMNLHQVLTLASIIEKETGASVERPLISSVYHNRLQKNMRLEADPTVIYGIPNFSGNITRKDLDAFSPYNTYRIKGLPPGPIANPGVESIRAALYPEPSDYLYFVAKKDKTHQFSTNFKDHTTAVRKYQLGRE